MRVILIQIINWLINKLDNLVYYIKGDYQETVTMESDKLKLVYYKPACKYGYTDCIHDCNYLKATYPKHYKKIGSPTDCQFCENGSDYDDEDK